MVVRCMDLCRAVSWLLLTLIPLPPLAHAGLIAGPFVPEKSLEATGAPLSHRRSLPRPELAGERPAVVPGRSCV